MFCDSNHSLFKNPYLLSAFFLFFPIAVHTGDLAQKKSITVTSTNRQPRGCFQWEEPGIENFGPWRIDYGRSGDFQTYGNTHRTDSVKDESVDEPHSSLENPELSKPYFVASSSVT